MKLTGYPILLTYFLLVGVACSASALQAQPAPDQKFLAELPSSITFSKTYTHRGKSSFEAPPSMPAAQKAAFQKLAAEMDNRLSRVVVRKSGKIRLADLVYLNGARLEVWVSGNMRFWTHSARPDLIEVSLPGLYDSDVPADEDFEELNWLHRATHSERADGDGTACDVYQYDGRVAWIARSTGLPLRFQSADMTIIYAYGPGPDPALVLPGKYDERVREVMNGWTGRAR
jgi:hypothetical protein